MIVLVDNYDSFTYNLYALFVLSGAEVEVIRENQPLPEKFHGVVLSPGPSRPESMPGSIEKLKQCLGRIPVFGVCLGMQIIAHVMGDEVSKARTIQHGKVDVIHRISDSFILKGLPENFRAVRYHSLSVKPKNSVLKPVAFSKKDGEIMAVENRKLMIFGVQFHPESILSEYGEIIAKNFLEVCYAGR